MQTNTIYFDIETTGLKPEFDRIVEIAAFCAETEEHFSELVNPRKAIPQEAKQIHGISDEMVESAAEFSAVGQNFCTFCFKSGTHPLLIAHNGDSFDFQFLQAELKRAHLPLPDWQTLDSLKWARKYRPDLPRHSLQFLRQVYLVAENNAHRALDDVMVLFKIFSQMIDDLPADNIKNILNQNMGGSIPVEVMPFGKHQGIALKKVPKSYLRWLKTSGALEKTENTSLREQLLVLGLMT